MSSDADVVEVYNLTRELDIGGSIRLEMIAEPDRALAVLRHAGKAPKIRNRAGFAVSNWKSGFDPRPDVVVVDAELLEQARRQAREQEDAEAGPPSLAAIEHAWSLQPSPVAEALLRAMAAALSRAGGFKPLQRELQSVYDRSNVLDPGA